MMNVDKYGWTFLFYHFPQRFRWQFPAAKSSLSQVHYLKLRDHDIGWLPDDDRFAFSNFVRKNTMTGDIGMNQVRPIFWG